MGLPLSGQLSKYSKDKYPLLASKGPNDGLTLLRDVIAPNSLTIIALGSDHFFAEDPKINAKTIALTILVISYLEGKKHQCHRLSQLMAALRSELSRAKKTYIFKGSTIKVLSYLGLVYAVIGWLNEVLFQRISSPLLSHYSEYIAVGIFGIYRVAVKKNPYTKKRFSLLIRYSFYLLVYNNFKISFTI